MNEESGNRPSALEQGAQVAGTVQSAIKLGKAISAAAKGAAAGPYGAAIAFAWQHKKKIGIIIASLLMIPILFIVMLPVMIFGNSANALTTGDGDTIILNDDEAVMGNIIEVNNKLHVIVQEGLGDTIARIDADFAASGADIKEVSNPYEGSQIMNPLLIIVQFCASKDKDIGEISLDNLTAIVRAAKGKLFDFQREIKTEMRMETVSRYNEGTRQWEDVEEEVEKKVAYYTISYKGESYFADEIFHLTDEQKMLSNDYYNNLLLYLQDKAWQFMGPGFDDLVGQYPFPFVPGGFATPLPSIDWRAHVTSEFGSRADNHRGIDIGAPYGTPIHAVKDGVVISASPWVNSWGIYVAINHGGGLVTLYAHMSKLNVSAGQEVKQGDIIGYIGMTGNTDGPHLHLEVQSNGALVNPRLYLP